MARLRAEADHHPREAPGPASETDVDDYFVDGTSSARPMCDTHLSQNTGSQGNGTPGAAIRVGRHHCIFEKIHGNLRLNSEGLQFKMHLTVNRKWRLEYAELKSVQKVGLFQHSWPPHEV